MNLSLFKNKTFLTISSHTLVLIYILFKGFKGGNDINVYLHASTQLFNGENIYADNPFNNYLYSPLFALLLRPISIFNFHFARIVWGLLNIGLAIRLYYVTKSLIDSIGVDKKIIKWWTLGTIIISFGFLNHNLGLGQISAVILWLTFEGLYQIIYKNKSTKGALILALGINIKIIPLIGLFYLFFKQKYKALVICVFAVIISLFLPAIIVGHDYNMKMLTNWAETINPSNSKYVFENSNGTHSLNAIIPSYFYDFNDGMEAPANLKRQIASVPHNTLLIIMQIMRISILLSLLLLIFYRFKKREKEPLYFYWEFSYLALISALIFPHQQKYAMLYFVPAGSYMILFILLALKLKWNIRFKYKLIAGLASFFMFVSAITGRDIIGNYLVNILDYYHSFGLFNLIFLVFLQFVRPTKIIEMNNELKLSNCY